MLPRLAIVFAMAAALLAVGPAGAEDVTRPRGVLELFTSQGCNSCPRADRLLGEYARSGDVIALAYHIDYWDYRGWRDTLGSAENTQRQRDYAKIFGNRAVYTPQAVINGRRHVNGSSHSAIEDGFSDMEKAGQGMVVDVSVERVGRSVVIDIGEAKIRPAQANVLLVYFDPARPVEITRGENKGETITYWNAVTGFQSAGLWNGEAAQLEMPGTEIDRKGAGGCAVLLQAIAADGMPGPILGAAMLAKPGS